MKKSFFYITAIICLIFTSCATTKVSSFVNPDIKISEYKKILVFGNIKDIDYRKTIENNFVVEFQGNLKNAVSSITVVSPLKNYTTEELFSIIRENNFDCILEISVMNAENNSAYVPVQTHTQYHSQWVNGQLIQTPYTTTSGGYSLSYPTASFEITLLDVATGEYAMKSTANSEGDELSDMNTIAKSLAKEFVTEFLSQK